MAGVKNYTPKENQYIIVNAEFDAVMDVEVLASAFNMEKADFMGHRILVDSFGELDTERLAELFPNEGDYTPLTDGEILALKAVPAVIVDIDWFMVYDNLNAFTEEYNGQGLYWNYFYHQWKTFSVSPFANAAVFVPGVPSITSVTISPDSAVVMPGQNVLLSATVVTENFAAQTVKWTATIGGDPADESKVYISPLGELSVSSDITAGTVITVKATSTVDSTKYDTATVTVYSE